mmetsp:Transcript_10232/g.11763  ORF Transcript_10232/g.11763 Transcript_10232/m.11763 type:complete len:92 (-) Transcript_10232:264-539(-)
MNDEKWDVMQPSSIEERVAVAKDFADHMNPSIPIFVDLMDDNARLRYGAWPERLAIIEDGKVAYYGAQGPFGYDPDEVEEWLENRFAPSNL